LIDRSMRVLALSDLHVDHARNRGWLEHVSNVEHQQDVLLLAGDVCDNMDLLERTLELLRRKFAQLFFVPGNHELWDRTHAYRDAIDKFERILERCAALGVRTEPGVCDGVRIVPLFSWYVRPEEGPDSLFAEKSSEDASQVAWADDYFVRRPESWQNGGAAEYFLSRNETRLQFEDDLPTVSFSHFLPRRDLMIRTSAETERDGPGMPDANPFFNFSRVAGTHALDRQIRRLRPAVHVYGHQHRNRWRQVEGILYVSHCLGYPAERQRIPASAILGPRVVWEA
jgi:predicted phosphodiesterase